MRKMIFHYPVDIQPGYLSGSTLRPVRMQRAFQTIGYEVMNIAGPATTRRRIMKDILECIKSGGLRVDFVYMEMPNVPIALSERSHWKLHPFLDYYFLARLKSVGVPIGVFVRDIYWRFDGYRTLVPPWKRAVSVPWFYYDFWWLGRLANVVFLPSLGMSEFFPRCTRAKMLLELPPGAVVDTEGIERRREKREGLSLLYVGSTLPPEYDLTPVLRACKMLGSVAEVVFTVCTYPDQWVLARQYYASQGINPDRLDNLRVVHLWGPEIRELYSNADVVLTVRQPDDYLRIAMPIKVFEALGYGVPVVANAGTPYGEFLQRTGMGWAIQPSVESILSTVENLLSNPNQLEMARERIKRGIHAHTWEARARDVAETLTSRGQGNSRYCVDGPFGIR